MTRRALLLSIGAALALGALWLGQRGGSPDSEPQDSARIEGAASSALVGERRPHFSLENLDGGREQAAHNGTLSRDQAEAKLVPLR